MKSNGNFRILALDGGGARGIYGAQILVRLETSLDANIMNHFDLIAGTSTGSILAGAAAVGIPMADIVKLFESEAPPIFRKRPLNRRWTSLNNLLLLCSSRSAQRKIPRSITVNCRALRALLTWITKDAHTASALLAGTSFPGTIVFRSEVAPRVAIMRTEPPSR